MLTEPFRITAIKSGTCDFYKKSPSGNPEGLFLFNPLDNYIGGRYNYIGIRYNGKRYTERGVFLENTALTEAVFYILLSLNEPLHGYGIMQNAEKLSGGRVRLAAGTLYGAINTLLEKGWITFVPGESGDRKKEYVITELGKKAVLAEIGRLRELVENGEKITGGWNE